MIQNFNEQIIHNYIDKDPLANCRDVTLQVTDECCLNCSYCYQTHKGHHMMTKKTARKAIDLLFQMYDENEEDAFINHHTYGITLGFIGGEPFLNIDTISDAMDYFIDRCVRTNHVWLMNSRANISSNGMLYFEPKVQAFLKKYRHLLDLTITIDGPKEMHDACRKDYNGNGSFDQVYKAWKDWNRDIPGNFISTKVTLSPENLPYLHTIFKFFINEGCTEIFANPIYEHEWTLEEAKLYYKQLIQLADDSLKDGIEYSSLFDYRHGYPLITTDTHNWCGGTSAMLAFDPQGLAYPCLRYMPSALPEDCPPLVIGDVNGIYKTPEAKALKCELCAVTRQSQSTKECLDCHIASGCAWCSAWNYQSLGTVNKRSTNICWMHRARSLANVYYWNMYYHNISSERRVALNLSRDIATQIISDEEYDKLIILSLAGW